MRAEVWPGGMGPPVLLIGAIDAERVRALLRGPLRASRQPIVVFIPATRAHAFEASVARGEWRDFDPGRVLTIIAEGPVAALDQAFRTWSPARLHGMSVVIGDPALPTADRDRYAAELRERHAQEDRSRTSQLVAFRSATAARSTPPRCVFGAADRSTTALRFLGLEMVASVRRLGSEGAFAIFDHVDDPFRPIRRLESLLSAAPDLLLSFVASRDRDWGALTAGIPTLSFWSSDPTRYPLDSMRFTDDDLVCVSDAAWIDDFAQRGVAARHLRLATGLFDWLPGGALAEERQEPGDDESADLEGSRPAQSHILLVGNLPTAEDALPTDLRAHANEIRSVARECVDLAPASIRERATSLARTLGTPRASDRTIATSLEFCITAIDRIRAATSLASASLPLRVHGCTRWQSALAGTPAEGCWAGPLRGRRASALAFREAAAVVNLTSRNGRDGVNMRVFDVAGCGGVLCSNDTPGLRNAFVLGEEAIGFAAVDELPDRCRRLLGDPQHADRIRRAARERTLRDHTWDSRWREVFGWLAERGRSHTAERRAA